MKKKYSVLLSFLIVFLLTFSNIVSTNTVKALTNYDEWEKGISNLNGTLYNSAKFGDRLTAPEVGWKRYDDTNSKIQYNGKWFHSLADVSGIYYKNTFSSENDKYSKIKISMRGQKIRVIVPMLIASSPDYISQFGNNSDVLADGVVVGHINSMAVIPKTVNQAIGFEYNFSTYGQHTVEIISKLTENNSNNVMGSLAIDAIDIDDTGDLLSSSQNIPAIEYQAHVQFDGWQSWMSSEEVAGTTGKGLRMEAIRIRFKEPYNTDNNLHIEYRAHVQFDGWQPWVRDGAIAGTVGKGLRMEAIEIRIVDNNGNVRNDYALSYQAHVQDRDWMPTVYTGETAGTTGLGLRMEALTITAYKK